MINENTASVLLAKWFMEKVRKLDRDENNQVKANASYKYAVIEDAYNVLGVFDFFDARERILDYEGDGTSDYNLSKFLGVDAPNRRETDELIRLGAFYLHSKLQESPKPRRVLIDYSTMERVREEPEPFFLEMIPSFTSRDLLNWYYEKHLMDPLPGNAHLTQMRNLLKNFPVDMVLYMIDASVMAIYDDEMTGPARAPAFLTDFIQEAEELYNNRKNTLIEGGLTTIVPRRHYFE